MSRQNWWIVADAVPILLIGVAAGFLMYIFIYPWSAVIPFIFILFTLYFFRNPERISEAGENEILSPADGVVLTVEEVMEDRYIKGPAVKVSIFLNIFNVHVNRTPLAGRVEYVHYQPGQFLPAFKGHASQINERNYVGIRSLEHPAWNFLVVQITGFVARRIVCWVKTGDDLQKGQRFGLIKFGSCTEVYLPRGAEISVAKGDKVRGGETIIGRMHA